MSLHGAEDHALGSFDGGEAPGPEEWPERRAREQKRKSAERAARHEIVLRRLRWAQPAGRPPAEIAASIDGSSSSGVLTTLRELAAEGRVHERDGLWYLGSDPEPRRTPPPKPNPAVDLGAMVLEVLGKRKLFGSQLVDAVSRTAGVDREAVARKIGELREAGEIVASCGLLEVRPPDIERTVAPPLVRRQASAAPSSVAARIEALLVEHGWSQSDLSRRVAAATDMAPSSAAAAISKARRGLGHFSWLPAALELDLVGAVEDVESPLHFDERILEAAQAHPGSLITRIAKAARTNSTYIRARAEHLGLRLEPHGRSTFVYPPDADRAAPEGAGSRPAEAHPVSGPSLTLGAPPCEDGPQDTGRLTAHPETDEDLDDRSAGVEVVTGDLAPADAPSSTPALEEAATAGAEPGVPTAAPAAVADLTGSSSRSGDHPPATPAAGPAESEEGSRQGSDLVGPLDKEGEHGRAQEHGGSEGEWLDGDRRSRSVEAVGEGQQPGDRRVPQHEGPGAGRRKLPRAVRLPRERGRTGGAGAAGVRPHDDPRERAAGVAPEEAGSVGWQPRPDDQSTKTGIETTKPSMRGSSGSGGPDDQSTKTGIETQPSVGDESTPLATAVPDGDTLHRDRCATHRDELEQNPRTESREDQGGAAPLQPSAGLGPAEPGRGDQVVGAATPRGQEDPAERQDTTPATPAGDTSTHRHGAVEERAASENDDNQKSYGAGPESALDLREYGARVADEAAAGGDEPPVAGAAEREAGHEAGADGGHATQPASSERPESSPAAGAAEEADGEVAPEPAPTPPEMSRGGSPVGVGAPRLSEQLASIEGRIERLREEGLPTDTELVVRARLRRQHQLHTERPLIRAERRAKLRMLAQSQPQPQATTNLGERIATWLAGLRPAARAELSQHDLDALRALLET